MQIGIYTTGIGDEADEQIEADISYAVMERQEGGTIRKEVDLYSAVDESSLLQICKNCRRKWYYPHLTAAASDREYTGIPQILNCRKTLLLWKKAGIYPILVC